MAANKGRVVVKVTAVDKGRGAAKGMAANKGGVVVKVTAVDKGGGSSQGDRNAMPLIGHRVLYAVFPSADDRSLFG